MTWNLLPRIYVVMLVEGGFVGFMKAGSRESLISALAFGVLIPLCAAAVIRIPYVAES